MLSENLHTNVTGNRCCNGSVDGELPRRYWLLVLLLIPLVTLFGNGLVVLSVIRERSLRNATNYFIVSLALADISLALMVMPICIWVEITRGYWGTSELLCDIFIMLDVMFSTASIMNLAAISVDRYVAVTRPLKYSRHNNFRRVYVTIACTWIISFFIALPIACGLNNTSDRHRHECRFNNSNFIILSSLGSFYIPAVILLILYYQIFKVIQTRARKATNSKRGQIFSNCSVYQSNDDGKKETIIPNHDKKAAISHLNCLLKKDKLFSSREILPEVNKTNSSIPSSSSPTTSDCVIGAVAFGAAFLTINPIIMTKLCHQSKKKTQIKEDLNIQHVESDRDSSTALTDEDGFTPEYLEQIKIERDRRSYHQTNGSVSNPSMSMEIFKKYQKHRLKLAKKGLSSDLAYQVALDNIKRSTSVKSSFKWSQKFSNTSSRSFHKRDFTKSLRLPSLRLIRKRKTSDRSAARRERKATQTLVIVLVIFLVCWVPFFTLNITQAFCLKFGNRDSPTLICTLISSDVGSVTVWLGYINSFLNPIIYTIFNIEFRRAFKRILRLS